MGEPVWGNVCGTAGAAGAAGAAPDHCGEERAESQKGSSQFTGLSTFQASPTLSRPKLGLSGERLGLALEGG